DLVVPLAAALTRRVRRVQDRLHDAATGPGVEPVRVAGDGAHDGRCCLRGERGVGRRLQAVVEQAVLHRTRVVAEGGLVAVAHPLADGVLAGTVCVADVEDSRSTAFGFGRVALQRTGHVV